MHSTETLGPVTFTAGEALARSRRVKLKSGSTTSPLQVEYADAGENFIGITAGNAKSGELVTVIPLTREGTFQIAAYGAFSALASLYGADDGMVDDTASGTAWFVALEAATAQGDIVEVVLYPHVSTTAATVSIADAGSKFAGATVEAALQELADAANIDITDAGSLITATTVEAALQELAAKLPSIAVADPGDGGAIPVTRTGQCAITTTGVDDTRTLAIPTFAGQELALSLDVDAGDAVVTVAAAINQTGNNTITMDDAGDFILLKAVQVAGALAWRVAANDGCTLSTV